MGLFSFISKFFGNFRDRKLRDYLNDSEQSRRFGQWAFGEGYEDASLSELMERWNRRHWMNLTLNVGGNVLDDLEKMIEIWRKHDIGSPISPMHNIIEDL